MAHLPQGLPADLQERVSSTRPGQPFLLSSVVAHLELASSTRATEQPRRVSFPRTARQDRRPCSSSKIQTTSPPRRSSRTQTTALSISPMREHSKPHGSKSTSEPARREAAPANSGHAAIGPNLARCSSKSSGEPSSSSTVYHSLLPCIDAATADPLADLSQKPRGRCCLAKPFPRTPAATLPRRRQSRPARGHVPGNTAVARCVVSSGTSSRMLASLYAAPRAPPYCTQATLLPHDFFFPSTVDVRACSCISKGNRLVGPTLHAIH